MPKQVNHHISVKGARVNNLKNLDVNIPRDILCVITGLSGSGKSSLAFDTLYAEGHRRFVNCLSPYARQFLGRLNKPSCDYIKDMPPAIALKQGTNRRKSRDTMAMEAEIYELLKLLFARMGKTCSPISGETVTRHSSRDVVLWAKEIEDETPFIITAPIEGKTLTSFKQNLLDGMKRGFVRIFLENKVCRIKDIVEELTDAKDKDKTYDAELIIDRLKVSKDNAFFNRLAEAVDTAFMQGNDTCFIRLLDENWTKRTFSKRFEADGITFEEPTQRLFCFNSPIGACPTCEGMGLVMGIDEKLVVPNNALSVYEGAIACWKGETMGKWLNEFILQAERFNFPIHRPYRQLDDKQKKLLWQGTEGLYGINDFFSFVKANIYKVQFRVLQARYTGKTLCPSCKGARLRKEALYVQIGGKNFQEIISMSVDEAYAFFLSLNLTEEEKISSKRLLTEIRGRLEALVNIGLGYLHLNRRSNSLSGGEAQRIKIASLLGRGLVGALYILDEPTIGLHARDTERLVNMLHKLKDKGNTVVLVEHDLDVIAAADSIIDIGPDAGSMGGEIVFQGNIKKLPTGTNSHTVRYLLGEDEIKIPETVRQWRNFIHIKGAHKNNLKGFDVSFPLNALTVVTGVSGSGKSSLVRDTFYEGVKRLIDGANISHIECNAIEGDFGMIKDIVFVDQNAIGKSSRSNPITYVGAYDLIRKLFAAQPFSKQMGYTASTFSFNTDGGRCDTCKGEGTISVEMQFMANITLTCEDCHGFRFKKEVLEVLFNGASIHDILEMTVNQAMLFFGQFQEKETLCRKIYNKLRPLQEVGLGYIKMGQDSSSLSGGENQRVKLASFLGLEKVEATLFIFDEPTSGLHIHDIKTLLKAFNALIAKGHSIVIVEHNMEVIKCADFIIDLGPEGGDGGGELLCCGTPKEIAACKDSYTGAFLKKILSNKP